MKIKDRWALALRGFLVVFGFAANSFAADVARLVDENNEFAFKLYKELGASPDNQFFSPYSISTCVGMVYAGARGDTAAEIARTFSWTESPGQLPDQFGQFRYQSLPNAAATNLLFAIANGLWAHDGYPILDSYISAVKNDFRARIVSVNFSDAAEPTRLEINSWVEDQTHKRITNLLPPGSVDDKTRLILVNAIYFKGKWQSPFEKSQTKDEEFFIAQDKTARVPFMHREGSYAYARADNLQVLEIPYQTASHRPEIVMDIFLPDKPEGFSKWESSFGKSSAEAKLVKMSATNVIAFIPRFKMNPDYGLANTLKKMGMQKAFSREDADFSGINGSTNLFVSAVVHKAFVEVNEEGTEAAAATGMWLAQAGAMMKEPPPVLFRADHPFIFLIREKKSGSILFMGRVVNPKS